MTAHDEVLDYDAFTSQQSPDNPTPAQGEPRKRSTRAMVRGVAFVGTLAVLGGGLFTAQVVGGHPTPSDEPALSAEEQQRVLEELMNPNRSTPQRDEYLDRAHEQREAKMTRPEDSEGFPLPSRDKVMERTLSMNTFIGCYLDGGRYSSRFHEGMGLLGDVNWMWCNAEVDRTNRTTALTNTEYGCYLDGGKWSVKGGSYPDTDAAGNPFVLVPESNTDTAQVTGTCVLPNNGEKRVEQTTNPNIASFKRSHVTDACTAIRGEHRGPNAGNLEQILYPKDTVMCSVTGVDAVVNRFTLARFASACWRSGGTFSDSARSRTDPKEVKVVGTCVPYVPTER